MSGETEQQVSAWTNDTVLQYLTDRMDARFTAQANVSQERLDALIQLSVERDRRYEQRFVAQEKAVQNALESAEKAVAKAETATEKRFEGVNEFRAQLADQARELMPRSETEALFAQVVERITNLEKKSDIAAGSRIGSSAAIGLVISLVITVIAVVGFITALIR